MRGLTLIVVFSLAGCGSGTYPVAGIVRFEDGKPAAELQGGFVIFQSADQDVSAQGDIRADGTFVLSTNREGDGALPGKYQVIVTQPPYRGPDLVPPEWIDPKFSKVESSPLEVTVEAKRNELTLDVRRGRGASKAKAPAGASK